MEMTIKPYVKGQMYAYLEHVPEGTNLPILIFLHGMGEKGNGTTDIAKLYRHGPPKLIKANKWESVSGDKFIVIAPQCGATFFNPKNLDKFIDFVKNKYSTDKVYLTGLSAGAVSIWNYLEHFAQFQKVAAAIPICGNGIHATRNSLNTVSKIPIWAFHGDKDTVVKPHLSINPINDINGMVPAPCPKAKVTIYNGVSHDSWSRTYDLTGMNKYDPNYDKFDINIYYWLLAQ